MSNELIRPIADSARAIEEASKAFSKAIEAAMQTGEYAGAVLGDLPHDLVGIIGDWVAHKRARRWAELSAETAKILRDRRIENREDVSPSVAIPLIAAAINEDRNVLKQLWAKLLASAMDPNRSNLVRPSLIELLKSMDPLDARVLRHMIEGVPMMQGRDLADSLAHRFEIDRDEVYFSMQHLYELGAIDDSPSSMPSPRVSAKGRLLTRAVGD
jgi:Abortive infection alpha